LGWLMSAQAVGGLTGGLIMAKIGERVAPAKLLGPCTLLFGIIDLMIFNYPLFFPGYLIAVVLFVLVGIPGAGSFASMMTLLQTSVQDDYRGRLFGAYTTVFGVITLIGMGFASTMGDVLGVIPVINIQGIVFVLAGLVAIIFLSERGMRLTNTTETV
jgi:MFS family permease